MLRVEHVTKVYPSGTVALKDVSFTVEDGEFLVVIGLSGSGKSTLLRCINRLIDPTEGRIIWDDADVTAASPSELRHVRRHIGMVFQQFNLVKRSSVITNVLSGRLGYANPMMSLMGKTVLVPFFARTKYPAGGEAATSAVYLSASGDTSFQ